MRVFISILTILLSFNTFAQKGPDAAATELTKEEKLVAFNHISNFLPSGRFKGNILGVPQNLLHVHRCVGGVFSNPGFSLSAAVYENKAVNLSGFSEDYHPNTVGVSFMMIDDKIIGTTLTDKKVSITQQNKTDNSTDTLEIEKTEDNHAIITMTLVRADGEVIKKGCDLDLDKKFKE